LKLQVSSYNNGITDWNAEAEETAFRSYKINHEFNRPAEAEIVLADPTGAIGRKYNADANDVYIGAGKVTIEDPDGTDVFYGRIIRAESSFQQKQVVLYCRDWLDQLDEEEITYDMREDLDGNGVRQSEVTSDVDGTCTPVSQNFFLALADDGGAQTDESTECNEDTADDMTLLPAAPAVNDYYAFGLDNKDEQITINISTAGVGTWTITWEYYGTVPGPGAGWYSLSGVSDGTSGFTVAGESTVSWTAPSAPNTWDLADPDGVGTNAYWIRARVSAYTSITTQPLGQQAWQLQKLYDDSLTLVADSHNGKYLIFTNEIAGTKSITTGPYADTVVGTETAGSYADVWLEDANFHDLTRNGATLTVDYDFHINAEMGSLYSSGPSAGKIYLSCICYNDTQANKMRVKVKSAAEAYYTIFTADNTTTTTEIRKFNIDIPLQYLSSFIDTLGEVTIQIEAEGGVGQIVYLDVYQCLIELTYTLTGTSSKYLITDTTTNTIVTPANLTYNGLGIFEGAPYSVIKPIYKHIDTGESGTLVSDGDVIIALTAAATIEHTSGFSARQYTNRTRFEILTDLADQDAAVFYMALGGTTLTWKSTFNNGAPTAITDATVNEWLSRHDYTPVINNTKVYGMRIGDNELFVESNNATSQSKFIATRTKTIKNTGLVSEYDATALGSNIVARDGDVVKLVNATIAGLDSTYRLGTEVSITSTWLDLSAVAYVVNRWAYDSETNETYITMYPRASLSTIGIQPIDVQALQVDRMKQTVSKTERDTYVTNPTTNTVT